MRAVDAPVHNIGWAAQGDLQVVCDGSWTEPKWGPEDASRTTDPEVYVADDDRLYTFEKSKVTCAACLDPSLRMQQPSADQQNERGK